MFCLQVCICTLYMPGLVEVRKRQLWATMWVLGTEPESFSRVTNTFDQSAISPAPSPTYMFLNIQNVISLVEPHSMNVFLNTTMYNS